MIAGLCWAATAAYMGLIWYLSTPSNVAVHIPLDHGIDKLLHMLEFGGLAWLWTISLRQSAPRLAYKIVGGLAFGVAAAYGMLDEYHQSFSSERIASAADAVADILGAALVVLAMRWWLHRLLPATQEKGI